MGETARDEATGQFSSAEPLTGLAGIEHDAGFVPFVDPNEIKEDEPEDLTPAEAAETYANSHTQESDIRTYGPLDDLPENVTLTVEQATKILGDRDEADAKQAEIDADNALRKEVDELRGEKAEAEAKAVRDPQLEPDYVEKALNHPAIRDAIKAQVGEAETARARYSQGVEIANQFAREALFQNVPEIASLPLEHWDSALMQLRQTDPARFGQIIGQVQRAAELQTAQQQQTQQRQQDAEARERQETEAYSRAETAKFDAAVKDDPKTRRAVENSIVEAIKEYGGDTAEFFQLLKSNKLLNSSVAQRILYDAGKYRQLQQASKRTVAATKGLPPVQRPGAAGQARSGNSEALAKANAAFNSNPTPENAARLYTLQQSRRA